MSKKSRKRFVGFVALTVLVGLIALDISRRTIEEARPFSWVEAAWAASQRSVVGIARSDDAELDDAISADSSLSYAQVKALVQRSVMLSGGLKSVIGPEDRWIVLKPNIVDMVPKGSPVITDVRVVKAVVELVYEAAPKAKITIAEGPGGWASPGHKEEIGWDGVDGFGQMGYTELLEELKESGIEVDLVDLNFDEVAEVPVPGGGYAAERYWYPRTIRECDVLISVPKMKVHNEPGISVAMKNMVGTAPGIKYGWPKMTGRNGNPGIPHSSPVVDECIVDLNLLAGVDFSVVDAIIGMDKDKSFGNPIRMNTIVAGEDVVAVDAVCARLMHFNPDDIEYISLGAQAGLGTSDFAKIEVRGRSIEETYHRFEKGERWTGNYGQSNRIWTLKGPFQTSDPEEEFVDAAQVRPIPGQDGWSAPVYFHHDKIDLDAYYHDPVDCAVYAYTEFIAPKSQKAELWIGSDESIRVWINGEEAYMFKGARCHRLPGEEANIWIQKGRNTLLVKENQRRGKFDFSLNICEPEPDDRYDGNRVFGLKFVLPEGISECEMAVVDAQNVEDFAFGDPYVASTIEGIDALEVGRQAPPERIIDGFPKVTADWSQSTVACLRAIFEYKGDPADETYLRGASGGAFRFYYSRERPWMGVGKMPDRAVEHICDVLGYAYAVSFNEDEETSWTRLKGWIHEGYPVLMWPDAFGARRIVVGYKDEGYVAYVREAHEEPQEEYRRIPLFLNKWKSGPILWRQVVGYPQFVIGEKTRTPSRREAALSSLRRAVALARDEGVLDDEEGRIFCGFAAYEAWIKDLREISYEALDEKGKRSIITFNGFFFPSFVSDREMAAPYLKKVAQDFERANRLALLDASNHYEKLASILKQIEALLPRGDWRSVSFEEEEQKKFENYPLVLELASEAFVLEREAVGELEKVSAGR